MSKTKWLVAFGFGLVLFAGQQVPFVIRGDYLRLVVWEDISPDARYRVEVRTQATFPAVDILDPWGTAYFAVIDRSANRTVATAQVPLDEIFDFQKPEVQWTSKHVEVLEFDESHSEAFIRLRLPQ